MKFRTKSGATICAPSFLQKTSQQQQNQTETPQTPAVKRKAEDPACDDMKRQKIVCGHKSADLGLQFFKYIFWLKNTCLGL